MIIIKKTGELERKQLIDIFRERIAVFIVEQACNYEEVDEYDKEALHIIDYKEGIRGYIRIIDKGDHIALGRFFIKKAYRGQGLGRKLLGVALEEAGRTYPNRRIEIEAQAYLLDFYQDMGFKPSSKVYLEDGIPHIKMVYRA